MRMRRLSSKASRGGNLECPYLPGLWFHNAPGPKQSPELLQVDMGKGAPKEEAGQNCQRKPMARGREEQEAVASPVAWAGPVVLAPALSPERLHSVFAFRFIQVPQKTERGRV